MNRDRYTDYSIREVTDQGLIFSKEEISGLKKLGEYYDSLPKTEPKSLKPWQVVLSMAGVALILTSCVGGSPGGAENPTAIPQIGPETNPEVAFGVIPTPEGILGPEGEIQYPTEIYCAPHLKICVAHQFDKHGNLLDPAILTSSETVADLSNNKVVLTGDLVAIPADGYGEIKTDIDASGNTIPVKGYVNRESTVMTAQATRELIGKMDLNDQGRAAVEAVLQEVEAKGLDVNINFRQILNIAIDPSGVEKLVDMDEKLWLRAGDKGTLAILTDKLEPFDKVEFLSDMQIASLNVVDNGVDQDQFVMEVYPSDWKDNGVAWVSPDWFKQQESIAASGERFTLLPDGTIQDGAITVPGLFVDKNGVMTLTVNGESVTLDPAKAIFDAEGGFSYPGYTLDEANGEWEPAVPTAETAAIALFDKYGVAPDTYTLTEVDGVIVGTDKETGTEIFRDGRFEISYAVDEIAKKDCETTNIEPYQFGYVQEKDMDSLEKYYDKLFEDIDDNDFNRFSDTALFDTKLFYLLVDREKQCWGFITESDVLLYRVETSMVQPIPLIHLTEDEKTEFIINR